MRKEENRTRKQWLSRSLILLMLIALIPQGRAMAEGVEMKFTLNQKRYTVNEIPTIMDAAPVSISGRTLLPVVYVATPLGADVQWEAATKKVSIFSGEGNIELWIGRSNANINGLSLPIDADNPAVKPLIMQGRTMLPLRFVAENLGCEVDWDPLTKEITIRSGGAADPGDEIARINKDKTPGDEDKKDEKKENKIEKIDTGKLTEIAIKDPALKIPDAMKDEKKDEGEGKKDEKKEPDKGFKEEIDALRLLEEEKHQRKAAHTSLTYLDIGIGSTMEEAIGQVKDFPLDHHVHEKIGAQFVYYADEDPEKKTAVGNLNHGLPEAKRLVIKGVWQDYPAKGEELPIRDLCILEGPLTKEQEQLLGSTLLFDHDGPSYWLLRGLNLNEGADGDKLYLMTLFTSPGKPRPFIKELLLISDLNLKPEGWEVVRYAGKFEPADLNKGTGGPPLYLIMKRGPEEK